jgi:hypothetical protein
MVWAGLSRAWLATSTFAELFNYPKESPVDSADHIHLLNQIKPVLAKLNKYSKWSTSPPP